jgi:hypothetical protein
MACYRDKFTFYLLLLKHRDCRLHSLVTAGMERDRWLRWSYCAYPLMIVEYGTMVEWYVTGENRRAQGKRFPSTILPHTNHTSATLGL